MNDKAVNGSTDILLSYGLPGVVILALVVVIVVMYRESLKKDTKLEEVQRLRVEDAKEITTKLKEPLEKVSDLSERMYDILRFDNLKREK